jgi:hypothetical protein
METSKEYLPSLFWDQNMMTFIYLFNIIVRERRYQKITFSTGAPVLPIKPTATKEWAFNEGIYV